jgi:pimeloyl-ACP methyl ester carboxylesterase
MDVMRGVLGEEKINYLGFSYGTYLGAVYGSLFPERLNRSVLDSAVNPNGIWRESFKAGAPAARANVDAWATWVGQRNRTFGLGKSAAEVFAGSEKVAAFLHKHPVRIPLVDVTLLDRTAYDQLIAEWTRDRQLWSVAATIVRVLRVLATGSITADSPQMVEVGAAMRRLESLGLATTTTPMGFYSNVVCEADWPTDVDTYYADMRMFRERYPFGWGVMVAAPTMCTFRHFTPPDPITRLSRDFPVGLVVQGEADTNTPYAGGQAMADALNEPLVTVTDDGRHGQYLYSTCVQDIVDRYLTGGEVPARRVSCPGAPRPTVPADSARAAAPSPASLGRQIDDLARDAVLPRALSR